MKILVFLFFFYVAAVLADDYLPDTFTNQSQTIQAIGGDLSLKMLMMEDGSAKGKCYCSCSLNSQPVFMEIDPSTLDSSDSSMMMSLN